MLEKDPSKRATLNDIFTSAWITENGKEMHDFNVADVYDNNEESLSPTRKIPKFGNLSRLLMQRNKTYARHIV